MAEPKTLLVFAPQDALEVRILVPKRRGKGYVKVPLYHNANALSALAYDIGFDLYGLDGSLDVQTGPLSRHDLDMLIPRIMEFISPYYGWPYRVVDHDEFWERHPLTVS